MTRIIGVLVLAIATSGNVLAQQYLAPNADAAVVAGNEAGTNYGSSALMYVNAGNGNNTSWAYVKFDTASVQGIVRYARLLVWARQSTLAPTRLLDVYAAPVSWQETTITWNNKPNPGSLLGNFTVPNTNEWVIGQIDVTNHVRAALAQGQVGFALETSVSSNRPISVPAKESQVAYGWQNGWPLIEFAIDAPPSVSITSPENGAIFSAPANITVSANAADSDGSVTQVQFFANGSLIGTDTTAPYSIAWTNVPAGTYDLTAVATDDLGATTTSAPVNITVNTGVLQLYFIHSDHLNTPRLITDASQRVVWRRDNQEPFNDSPPDENPSGLGVFEFPLGFPGQYFDKETNLAYNWMRDFDPALGAYKQSDPLGLGAGLNTYGYVRGSPLRFADPNGQFTVVAGAALVSAAIIGGIIYSQNVANNAGRPKTNEPLPGEVPWSTTSTPAANSCPFFPPPDDCATRKAALEADRKALLFQIGQGYKLGRAISDFNDRVDGHNTFCSSHPVDRI